MKRLPTQFLVLVCSLISVLCLWSRPVYSEDLDVGPAEAPAPQPQQQPQPQPRAEPAQQPAAPAAQAPSEAQTVPVEAPPEAPTAAQAPKANSPTGETTKQNGKSGPDVDFEHEDTFVDIADALKSKQYVRRAILSTVIRTTAPFTVSRFYINHLIGFTTVWQRTDGDQRYYNGTQTLSLGYVTEGNHGFEVGADVSSLSDLFLGYRYFIRPEKLSLYPFVGGGAGMEMKALSIIDKPANLVPYTGPQQMVFLDAGLFVPLVEVGLKVEFRLQFYGASRLVFTQGVGAIFFL